MGKPEVSEMSEKISNSIYLGFGTLEIILLLGLKELAYTDNYMFLWIMPIFLLGIPFVRWYDQRKKHSREL